MRRLKRLIIEAHRRSLWQVLGVYLVTSWVVIQVVNELTRAAGLPDWVPGFALVLLLIGLPIVLATAVVQEGGPGQGASQASAAAEGAAAGAATSGPGREATPGPEATPALAGETTGAAPPVGVPHRLAQPTFLQRHLTWPRAILGGVAAFALLAVLVGAYFVSWATGIGPMGSLLAQGTIERGERIVLADFGTAAPDTTLGRVVTDALRIDLLETPVLRVLESSDMQEALALMQADRGIPLTPELAREVALREGIKAVLDGEIAQAGTGYVLTATLRSAETGRSLAAFRETASGPDGIIPAIDRLSRRIRERAGESLRSINAGQPLERVTTSSLEALRLFSEADRAFDDGDYHRSIALLDEALASDPDFAMAWRRLGVAFGNLESDRVRELEAYTRAYELRHRLSDRERYLAEARYYGVVSSDRAAEMEAYRRVLRIDPDDRQALNNLALAYRSSEDNDAAAELLERAIRGPGISAVAFTNLFIARLGQGRYDDALEVADAFAARYPEHPNASRAGFVARFLLGDENGARAVVEPLLTATSPQARVNGHDLLARLALWRGRIGEAREHLEAAERAAAEAGPSLRLTRRLFTAHAEVVTGNHDRALRLVRAAADDGLLHVLAPANQWHFFRAMVLAMAGDADGAEAVLQDFDEAVPTEHHDRFRTNNTAARALIPVVRGEPEKGIRLLEEVRSARRCRACYAERMGWALAEAGRLAEAAEEWETAATWRDFTHSFDWQMGQILWTMQRLGPLYEELGDSARAVHHYGRLAQLWADADPELQPVVRHARERIAELGGAQEALVER